MSGYLRLETSIASEKTLEKAFHALPAALAQPVSFKRQAKGLPELKAEYFFGQKDSAIHYILYQWDRERPVPSNKTIGRDTLQNFIQKYAALRTKITRKYGKGKAAGNLKNTSAIASGDFQVSDTWAGKDSSAVDLSLTLTLSDRHVQSGNVPTVPTYRIRLYVRSTKALPKPPEIRLSAQRTDSLNAMAQAF